MTELRSSFSLPLTHITTKEQFLFTGKSKKKNHPFVHTCWCYTLNPQLPCLPAKGQEFLLNFRSLSLLWNYALALPLCQCEANLHLTSHHSVKTRRQLTKWKLTMLVNKNTRISAACCSSKDTGLAIVICSC